MIKNLPANAGDAEDEVRSLGQEDPWNRKWQPTPVFLPGNFHGQRSLAGYSPWDSPGKILSDLKESDMPEGLTHTPSPNPSGPKTISPLFSLNGLIDL